MTATTQTAIDEMFGMVASVMLANFPDAVRKYDGIDSHEPPDGQSSWIYAAIRHADSTQASLAGETGARRWRRIGVLMVQCFVPLNKTGRTGAMNIATTLQSNIQGKATASCVWFRDATAKEIGPDKSWYQANFVVAFEYDDIQ